MQPTASLRSRPLMPTFRHRWRASWHIWAMKKSRRRVTAPARATGAPFLHRIVSLPEKMDQAKHPFNVLEAAYWAFVFAAVVMASGAATIRLAAKAGQLLGIDDPRFRG